MTAVHTGLAPRDVTPSPPARVRVLSIGAEPLSTRAGGLNRYTDGLARALINRPVQQEWLVAGKSDQVSGPVGDNPFASPYDSLPRRLLALKSRFRETEASFQPDLVASHFALYTYPVAGRLRRMPHVVHFHGPWADESKAEGAGRIAVRLKRHVERSVYGNAVHFITLSRAFAGVLAERYGVSRDRITVIPGGVQTTRFTVGETRQEARQRLGWDVNRPTVLCVRRLVNRMGLEELLTAMQTVRASHPDALLMIAGKGPLSERLSAMIDDLGLRRHARLLGFVPDELLPLAYRAADFSVVPSQSLEGFGLIIPESLAAGTPALVTPVGGMPEVVADLSEDLVLGGASVPFLVDGLSAALGGSLRLPSQGGCRDYACRRFEWDSVADRVLGVYSAAIKAHG